MSAALFHTCAIVENGDVKCWGRDDINGQLGDGGSNTNINAPSSTPIDLGTGRTAVAISAGASHSCAILDTRDVKCWGSNYYGQLGDGGYNNTNAPSSTAIDLGVGRTAVAISTGYSHTCALLDNADLKCWGYSFSGQLGIGILGLMVHTHNITYLHHHLLQLISGLVVQPLRSLLDITTPALSLTMAI